eukprot:gene3092-13106_t
MERKVARGQLEKHISVGKKVNAYLDSSAGNDREKSHAKKTDSWLATLERQIKYAVVHSLKSATDYPKAVLVRNWVKHLKINALESVTAYEAKHGKSSLSFYAAKLQLRPLDALTETVSSEIAKATRLTFLA